MLGVKKKCWVQKKNAGCKKKMLGAKKKCWVQKKNAGCKKKCWVQLKNAAAAKILNNIIIGLVYYIQNYENLYY